MNDLEWANTIVSLDGYIRKALKSVLGDDKNSDDIDDLVSETFLRLVEVDISNLVYDTYTENAGCPKQRKYVWVTATNVAYGVLRKEAMVERLRKGWKWKDGMAALEMQPNIGNPMTFWIMVEQVDALFLDIKRDNYYATMLEVFGGRSIRSVAKDYEIPFATLTRASRKYYTEVRKIVGEVQYEISYDVSEISNLGGRI